MVQTIGIMGGTFDPIHIGHLRCALEVQNQLHLDHIRFVPTYQSPTRNQPLASAQHRLKMVELATQSISTFIVDSSEIDQATPSYTINTLERLRQYYGNQTSIGFIMGMDAFQQFHQWHRFDEFLNIVHLILLSRPNYTLPTKKSVQQLYQKHLNSKTTLAEQGPCGTITPIKTTQLAISASQIRTDIHQKKSPQFLLPDNVWHYINQHNLYIESL